MDAEATHPELRTVTVGGYRIVRTLGGGASGTVYVAIDDRTEMPVALKVLGIGLGTGDSAFNEARGRFLVEAYAARRLQHPGIAGVIAAGEEHGRGWIAMELFPGIDLARYARPARLLPPAVLLRIMARAAEALDHAHSHGIVHRDLKPSNIMVDWPTDVVKLTDFGLARTADAESTRTGMMLGTPAYMAPEQLAGAVPDSRSDLYGFGATLFHLLTGQLPHEGHNLGDLLRRVSSLPAPDLRSMLPDADPKLAELVAALLARSARERPASASEVAELLAALAARAAGPMSRR